MVSVQVSRAISQEVQQSGSKESRGGEKDCRPGKYPEEEKSSCAGATAVDLVEVTDDVSNVGVNGEDVTVERDYSEGVQRIEMYQQEMEGSRLDRAGIG